MRTRISGPVKAWHFLPADKRLGYDDGRLVQAGKTYRIPKDQVPVLCSCGMHGSRRALDALNYAYGGVVCRVEISGDIVEGEDKLCGRERKVLWLADATNVLHEFACRCAEDALARVKDPDPRSVAAVEAKRAWLRGEISGDELAAAWDAAWDAAQDAAWDAAWGAAWYAAWGAAWNAARGAARDAAWGAARVDAREAQNRRLTAMLVALHRKQTKGQG